MMHTALVGALVLFTFASAFAFVVFGVALLKVLRGWRP